MSHRILPTLLIPILIAIAPAPAVAARGDIGCIAAKLGPAAMARIGAGVIAAAEKGTDPARALDADRDALIAGRDACRAADGWSPDATQAAVSFAQSSATRLGAESALKADGVDTAKLAATYAALPVTDRRSLIARASPGALNAVTASSQRPAVRRHVLLYFAALAGLEFYPAEFAAA